MSVALFANIFFHSEYCLFVYGFLCCVKAFKFNWIPFAYFCFYFHYSRNWIKKKSCCNLYQRVLPIFISKHFIMSVIMFRSLIHLSFFFCVCVCMVLGMGFPGSSVVNNPPANAGDRRYRFDPRCGKIPWSRKWKPTRVFLPGKFHTERNLVD